MTDAWRADGADLAVRCRDARVCSTPTEHVWVAWCFDDADGPEGGIALRCFDAGGGATTRTLVVARGARGGFELGGVAALPDGGVAVCWRGEESLAWFSLMEPTGRTYRVAFLEECAGRPAIAASQGGAAVVVYANPTRGVVAQSVGEAGELRARLEERGGGPPVDAAFLGPELLVALVRARRVALLERGRTRVIEPPVERIVQHAPAVASCSPGRRALCAWIGEDTGRFALFVGWSDGGAVRVADVWTPLERASDSAPAVATRGGEGGAVAWREERGPRPAVYLRALDAEARQEGAEVRVTAREAIAPPGRVGLARVADAWLCAHVERRDAGDQVVVRRVIDAAFAR